MPGQHAGRAWPQAVARLPLGKRLAVVVLQRIELHLHLARVLAVSADFEDAGLVPAAHIALVLRTHLHLLALGKFEVWCLVARRQRRQRCQEVARAVAAELPAAVDLGE